MKILLRAVKLLKGNADEAAKDEFVRECESMLAVDHPNLVRMVAVCVQQAPWLCILEHMPYGDLLVVMRACRSKEVSLTADEMMSMCLQLARGCQHICSKRLVHCDIAARNCLVGEGNVVKIADFGLTQKFDDGKDYHTMRNKLKLPIKWLALDCMSKTHFSEKTDVWSFGVLAWEIFSYGGSPYQGVQLKHMRVRLMEGLRLEAPSDCPPQIWGVLAKCFTVDPRQRWTFAGLAEMLEKVSRQLKLDLEYDDERELGVRRRCPPIRPRLWPIMNLQ